MNEKLKSMLDKLNVPKRFITWDIRLGTKIAILNMIVAHVVVLMLNFVLPLLALGIPGLAAVLPKLGISATTVALMAASGTFNSINELRKGLENKTNIKTKNYVRMTPGLQRLGTKIMIVNWVVSILVVLLLNIAYPLLVIEHGKAMVGILASLSVSATTTALLGNSVANTVVGEVRKLIENRARAESHPG